MLSYFQSVYVVFISVAIVLLVMQLLNKMLPDDMRKRANSVNGWQLNILGSIYAVALGFMLSDAWLAFQTANNDVRSEAAAALTIDRSSNMLPTACSAPLQTEVVNYLNAVDTVEWPTMETHAGDFRGSQSLRSMWGTVNGCDAPDALQARGRVLDALQILQGRRDSRLQDYDGHLPFMMWAVLIFGGVTVVISSCLLGNEKKAIHCFHVISLTVLITVTLLAISDLDRPFEGATRVSPQAFRNVLSEIRQPLTK